MRTPTNRVPPWPLKPKRAWFAARDGSGYYRNCPLIAAERDDAIRLSRRNLVRQLMDEWDRVFRKGVIRQAELGENDVLVQQASFREAYPDDPRLWLLDDD